MRQRCASEAGVVQVRSETGNEWLPHLLLVPAARCAVSGAHQCHAERPVLAHEHQFATAQRAVSKAERFACSHEDEWRRLSAFIYETRNIAQIWDRCSSSRCARHSTLRPSSQSTTGARRVRGVRTRSPREHRRRARHPGALVVPSRPVMI